MQQGSQDRIHTRALQGSNILTPPSEIKMAPQKPIDLLSQMQCELHRLSELFFSTIGELQQNALPVSVNEEELVRPSSTSYDAGARSKGFSEELGQVNHHIWKCFESLL